MELSKTIVIEQYARLNGFTNVRYDPIGVGKSTINDMTVQVEDWLNSALAMVDHICDKDTPIIIVSSSVGSWMSTHVAMQRPSNCWTDHVWTRLQLPYTWLLASL